MEIIKGKKTYNIDREKFLNLIKDYEKVILDIGTGDGKFVYNKARNNPKNFYIGLDPNRNALEKYSHKINRKPSKGGLNNALYVIALIENLPPELYENIDKIYINFPWASLLKYTVTPDLEVMDNLKKLTDKDIELEMNFNYSSKYEPAEMEKLGIEDLSEEYIENNLIPEYRKIDIIIGDYQELDNEYIKNFEADWSKKLAYGRDRKIWKIKAIISK